MQTEVVTDLQRLRDVQPEWQDLASRSGVRDVFLLPQWFFPWWEVFCGKKTPFFVLCWNGGQLCGLLPLFKSSNGPFQFIHFSGHPHMADRMDVVSLPGYERDCLAAFAQTLSERKDWDLVFLRQFGQIFGNPEVLKRILQDAGIRTILGDDASCPYIDMKQYGNFSDYVSQVMGKNRKKNVRNLKNKLNKLDGVTWEMVHSLNQRLLDEMAELDTQQSLRGKIGKSFFRDPLNRKFLAKVSKELGPEHVRVFVLRVGGTLVAYDLLFSIDNRLFSYQTAYHMSYARLGPGTQVQLKTIEYAFEQGFDEYDFLAGDERYKMGYASNSRRNKRLMAFRGGLRSIPLRLYYECGLPVWRQAKARLGAHRNAAFDIRNSDGDAQAGGNFLAGSTFSGSPSFPAEGEGQNDSKS